MQAFERRGGAIGFRIRYTLRDVIFKPGDNW